MLKLYNISDNAYKLFVENYKTLNPLKPVKGFQHLTLVQLAALTSHREALDYFAQLDNAASLFTATDPAGCNLLHITAADPLLFQQTKDFLEKKFAGLSEQLLQMRCHAGHASPHFRALTPLELSQCYQPLSPDRSVPMFQNGQISRISQEEFFERYRVHYSSRATPVISPAVFAQIARPQLLSEAVGQEEKTERPLLREAFDRATAPEHLAVTEFPSVDGRPPLALVAADSIPKGALLSCGGMLVPQGEFPLEIRMHSIEGPWKRTILIGSDRIFSPCMLIRQGRPNCVLLTRTEIRGRHDSFPSFTRWEPAYRTLRLIAKGELLAAADLSAHNMLNKYLPVPGTWEHLRSLSPSEIRHHLQTLSRATSVTPLIASDLSFYFLNSTIVLYLLLQDKIPPCTWQALSILHGRLQQSKTLKLDSKLYETLGLCQKAIAPMDPSVKQMFCHFLEKNLCSTKALLMMISSFPPNSWRPGRKEFFTVFTTLIDLVCELGDGSPYGTVIKDSKPKALSQERCNQIVEQISNSKPLLESQMSEGEKDWLKAFLIKVILELPQRDSNLLEDWKEILASLLEIFRQFFPELANSILNELRTQSSSTEGPEQKGD